MNAQNYYNEFDQKAAEWLRHLIAAKQIPDGHVDERSIAEVQPSDLAGYRQCHFFAGIGGWSYALQLAGWSDDVPVWTGSCPCQPLSCAGKRQGEADERHLWPEFYRLIAECRPTTVFGEQVASNDGLEWFDGISLDLEEIDYAIAAADLPAACVGKPHKRQRIFWCADLHGAMPAGSREPRRTHYPPQERQIEEAVEIGNRRIAELVAVGVAQRADSYATARSVVDGIPEWMANMRGYGNAIVPQVAARFIRAYLESA